MVKKCGIQPRDNAMAANIVKVAYNQTETAQTLFKNYGIRVEQLDVVRFVAESLAIFEVVKQILKANKIKFTVR